MINIENITKSFGSQALFEGVSFKINSRERVGLVGRNGHGKTTLFRIIVGEESVEEGAIIIPRNYRVGYVRQQIEFTEKSVLLEGMKCLPESERDHHWKVEKILAGLGFSQTDMERNPLEFSGGYQVRLNLAKVLVSEPDLLLLDEPTNYLDITSIRWVERFLLNWPHEVMLITHDRSFMDRINNPFSMILTRLNTSIINPKISSKFQSSLYNITSISYIFKNTISCPEIWFKLN